MFHKVHHHRYIEYQQALLQALEQMDLSDFFYYYNYDKVFKYLIFFFIFFLHIKINSIILIAMQTVPFPFIYYLLVYLFIIFFHDLNFTLLISLAVKK